MNFIIDGEKVIAFVIPVHGTTDQFALGVGRRIIVVSWDGKSPIAKLVRTVGEVELEDSYQDNRFNDAKADPTGRFYGGTMRVEAKGDIFEARLGSLYKYNSENGFDKLKSNISVSNGLTWNEKAKKMYYIDSCDLDVKEFDYDSKTGDLCKFFFTTI